jgi:hypothetical protein
MTDPYCQINKMRLQKVAINKLLFFEVACTLTGVVSFRYLSYTKFVTGTPKKGPKMVFESS